MKDSGWSFDKFISMTIFFLETAELNGSNYLKIPLRSSALLNFETDDKYCFLRSILASLYPCNNNHPNRVSNYRQYFDELSIDGCDFSNGFRCSDFHKFEKINNLSINLFELSFYQDQNEWKHNFIPIEVSKNFCDRVTDFLIYKNHYVLNKKLHVFSDNYNSKYICRRFLKSYSSQIV